MTMYNDDFAQMFFEFMDENSDNAEALETIKPFLEYGWGESDKTREFIGWMAENDASLSAIKATINLLTE